MSTGKRLAITIFSVGIIGIIVFIASALNTNPSKAMENVPIGSTYQELVDIAGDPSCVTDGTLWVEPEYKKDKNQIIEGCVKELWYESFPKFIPSKYSFCFSEKGILMHKYHWTSW